MRNTMTTLMQFNRLFVSTFLLLAVASSAFSSDVLNFYKGDVRVLKVKPVERVAVGNGKLLSTSITTSGQLIILAEGVGDTAIHLWHRDGTEKDIKVFINNSNSGRTSTEVAELLNDIEGVNIRTVGGRTVLEGELDERQKPIIEAITKVYPDIVDLTVVPQVSKDRMIYMNVQLTEFNKRDLENLGVAWDTTVRGPTAAFASESNRGQQTSVLQGTGVPTALSGGTATNAIRSFGYFGIAAEITSRLNFLVTDGDAIILAEPRLSARSGGEAEFLAGGEVPIPTTNTTGQSNVEFKEFGIILNIKPVADSEGNIIAKVETEISTVDNALAVNGIPGFRTRKTSADISLRDGETLVISGLVNSELSKTVSKVKWLGDIPILGPLFRSTNFEQNKSELVIFVTPNIVDANSQQNADEIARRDTMLSNFKQGVGSDANILD